MNKFPKQLQQAIKENGLNQTKLAELLNTSQQTISHWCTGENEPSLDDLIKLCQILNISADELLGIM